LEKILEMLDRAEDRSAWFVPYAHDLDPEDYPERYEKFVQMLDELQHRDIWVETYGGVVRYMREKIESSLTVVSEGGSEIVLELTHSLDPAIYDAPLTIRAAVPSAWALVRIQQGDSEALQSTVSEGGETVVYFDAIPNHGQIRLVPDSLPTEPVIAVDPAMLSPACGTGTNAPSQMFDVWNAGGGTLAYQISTDSGWLVCDVESGTSTGGKDSVMVAYSTAGLAAGTHSANILISDPNATNSPVTIPVNLTVSSADALLELGFEEGTGAIAFDSSGNANDGAISGPIYSDDPAKGIYALHFDGVDDRVDVSPDSTLKPSDISVSLWVKQLSSADNSGYQGIVRGAYGDGYSGGFRILVNQSRPLFQMNFGDAGPKWIWGTTFPLDSWVHLAWTYDHQSVKIYQNGQLFTEVPESRDIQWSTYNSNLMLGYAQWYYGGLIDEVMMFDHALSADQIGELYQGRPDTPVIAAEPTRLAQATNIGETAESQALAIWNSGDGTLNFAVSSNVDWMTLAPEAGTSSGEMSILSVHYESAALAAGVHSGAIQVIDGNAGNSPFSIPVELTINTPPIANDANFSTAQDTSVEIVLTGVDADGDSLVYRVSAGPQNGALSGTAPALTYAPDDGFVGGDAFTFQVDDSNGGTDSGTVSITVTAGTPANAPPVADDAVVETVGDTPVAITLFASDPDGDELAYMVTAGPQKGVLSGTAPELTYTPDPAFTGADSITFQVDDGNGGTDIGTVSITVTAGTPANGSPVADDAAVATVADTPVAIILSASDPDGDELAYLVTAVPQKGVLTGTAPELTYAPDPAFTGADSITFQVEDSNGGTDTGTVSITVRAANSGAVMELHFDEGAGTTALDASGNGIDGSIAGAVYTPTGAEGPFALAFDGTDDRVTCGYNPSLKPAEITVSFWVKHVADTSAGYGGIIQGAYGNGYNNGFRVIDYKNKPLLQLNVGDSSPLRLYGNPWTPNQWTHLAFTYNHQTIDFYQNGRLVTSVPETRDINWTSTGGDLYVGFAQWYFQGEVDDVRLFGAALSSDQIGQLFGSAN
jgi:hypothetical protein